MEQLAYFRENKRGTYDILARWNEKGLFRVIEVLVDAGQADLYVKQLCADDQMRHAAWKETRGWDFESNAPAKPKAKRQPREKIEPVSFSFE